VVEIDDGLRGYGHVLGRDAEQARRVAILDALWQAPASRDVVEAEVLSPIAERIAAERARADAATAATRVDFFTLVRGEDET
jgi:alpha-D-ribose 1-methylphosphonate 5-triphosphate synthase subunit PhnG